MDVVLDRRLEDRSALFDRDMLAVNGEVDRFHNLLILSNH
jgi:hypothetical protein